MSYVHAEVERNINSAAERINREKESYNVAKAVTGE